MIIRVKVKTKMPKQKVENFGDHNYLVYLESEPEENKANIELINLLSKYFGTPHQRIHIKSGATSEYKLLEIG